MMARRFFISGRVQGVGFRYFAVRVAQRHGIMGYVRNLPDGRVEVLAEGDPTDMAAFQSELEAGPAYAHVSQVEEVEVGPTGRFTSFGVEF